ncbi:MAG: LysE family translocator [Maritimibacter sp.]|nr:LysE family translocator [Maritimibacter sp.]
MTPDLLLALYGFVAIMCFTPGPNNLMLMASGTNYGFPRSVPHLLGVVLGFSLMVVLVGLGLAAMFTRYPEARTALKIASVAYLLYLAWKIARAAPPESAAATGRPLTFLQASAFQWVNPKGWTMALTSIAAYAPDQSLWAVLVVAFAFLLVNSVSGSLWVLIGQQIRRFLTNRTRLAVFNGTMAILLVATLIPVLFA